MTLTRPRWKIKVVGQSCRSREKTTATEMASEVHALNAYRAYTADDLKRMKLHFDGNVL